jgi:hypothetical protein
VLLGSEFRESEEEDGLGLRIAITIVQRAMSCIRNKD